MDIKLKRLWNNIASVRDYSVKKAISKNENIIVTVVGLKGKMVLTPDILKTKAFQAVGDSFDSKFGNHKKYKLVDFQWRPDEI